MLLGIPTIIFSFLFSKEIIFLLFGKNFLPSVKIFSLLIFLPLIVYPTTIFGYHLFAYNLQKKNTFFSSISALFNLVLNLIFIPLLGILGAALATLASQFLNFYLFFRAVKALEGFSLKFFLKLKKIFLSSCLLAVILIVLKNCFLLKLEIKIALAICLGGLSYLLVLLLLKEPLIKFENLKNFK